ncbi:uncharacterized protein LOC125502075 [Athalia rosae]|uniref:uncharacterized protein LOC125502075 n=1 Tax=Athalia rosae TaxID=37344 RepID=UPI002033B4CE|nr:uncharacterized protein LOC125502075 [Athalia rosae]
MSERYNNNGSQNFYSVVSPVRGSGALGQGRGGAPARRSRARVLPEKRDEPKNVRDKGEEEAPAANRAQLNLTLVGSPAPRSQVRTLIAAANAARSRKTRSPVGGTGRSREPIAGCLEKLNQFADNPTKFVRLEGSRGTGAELELDLAFSERTDESDNYYDSHNIAFGENGEYRIPEYDHIRFLQFSVGDARRSGGTRPPSAAAAASPNAGDAPRPGGRDTRSPISSLRGDEVRISSGELLPEEEVSSPGNPESADSRPRGTRSHPLGSAANYKNTVNPAVERFMLDPGGGDDSPPKVASGTSGASASSPGTGRTNLSRTSSADGTWHAHSLNSPYFASLRGNDRGDLDDDSSGTPREVGWHEEPDERLTIVKDSARSSANGAALRYTFIADEIAFAESPAIVDGSVEAFAKIEELDGGHFGTPEVPRSPASPSSSSSSSSSRVSNSSASSSSRSSSGGSRGSSKASGSAGTGTGGREGGEILGESGHAVPSDFAPISNDILRMTVEEVYLAAEYSRKLSAIFDQVLKRSESGDSATGEIRGSRTQDFPRSF